MTMFDDRRDGGRQLAARLGGYARREDVTVLALPRGGVPVAFEVARALQAPLDVIIVRKLGSPGQEELAMGAVASGGVRIINDYIVGSLSIPTAEIERVAARELREIERREAAYRGSLPPLTVSGRTVILVDDGIATGATMRAAVAAVRKANPTHVVVAAPSAAPDACREIAKEVDEMVCVATPDPYIAVGAWYREFAQTSDDEVRRLLGAARGAESS